MKSRLTEILVSIILVVSVFASACCICAPDREPAGFSIPKADIIYQALNNQLSNSGTGIVESNNLIGFVNADGSGNKFIKLKYRAFTPVFSIDAGGIFFRSFTSEPYDLLPGGGETVFLSDSGIYRDCGDYDDGFSFPVKDTGYVLVSNGVDIELMDMTTCKVIKRLVEIPDELPWVKSVDSAYPSSSGKSMVFTETYRSPWHHVIYITDFETGNVNEVLQGGYNASFSPDDQRIAYLGNDGIYVANADGSANKLIVRIDLGNPYFASLDPYPFWSPDGKTLIYHKCIVADCIDRNLSDYSIFKVDVNSGVEQKIIDGGLYPVWIK